MKKEVEALENNTTWVLADLPPVKKAIDSKWVYKFRYKPSDEFEQYKDKLFAKGFTQMEGVDFQ